MRSFGPMPMDAPCPESHRPTTSQKISWPMGGIAGSSIALTGGAGAEIDLADGFALRAEYVVQHYPSAASTYHGGQAGVVFKFD